ncbi:hypothetical protein [Halobacteriovorax sp. JY17]|uniref:hypothetical protein n=1 Tax=Halobacteriovorax sp. JY17 TaxID=2014617 RepID=UPI000C69F404|nr:hypothetical protein [Halobacteriovorax sp. JY17]PIK15362.1 MAG: hypothetical protein CES88_01205 [Halobacteriovorax sp. JY17]
MILLIIITFLHILFSILLFIQWIIGEKKKSIELDYSSTIPKTTSYHFEKFEYTETQNLEIKAHIERLRVNHIYFIHGTFVGDDPFDILSFIERAFPSLSGTIIERVKLQIKSGQNLIVRELGNFHPNLILRLKEICPDGVEFSNFTWSSSNHHIARLRGAIQLMNSIALQTREGERVLLYGHSHAGQLFTLMSQLCSKSPLGLQLKSLLYKSEIQPKEMEELIMACKKRRFDFVTLGTPVRYPWNTSSFPKAKLLHFINHRGTIPIGGGLTSSITTRSGDYIQQWAVAGSDSKSPVRDDQILNEELDLILGTGSDVKLLQRNIKFKKRLHDHGEHFLVDFKDNSKIPNSFLTIFGHGVYTKKNPMFWIINHSLEKLK